MNLKKVIATVCVGIVAASVIAQPGGGGGRGQGGRMGMMGGGNPAMLLVMPNFGGGGGGRGPMGNLREDLETDLKLTDDQKTKLEAIREKQGERMRAMFAGAGGGGGGGRGFQMTDEQRKQMEKNNEETTKEVNAILTPDQQKRVKQIGIQLAGNGAVRNEEVAKDLGITTEQKAKIDNLFTELQKANQTIGERMQSGELDREAASELRQKNQAALGAEIQKILTDAQKAKLKDLAGPEFKRTEG